MNPFSDSQTGSRLFAFRRLATRPPVIVFALCLGLGLAFVAGLAKGRKNSAQDAAQAKAQIRASALQQQFRHALAAVEVLNALARQSGGTIPDFQRVATELQMAHPGLDTLELQPGGVVKEIVPRAGHERAIGVDVLKEPRLSAGAYAAMQSRNPTATGPVSLYNGGPSFVVRAPYVQRGRDGRDYFQGFVAVSIRQSEVLRPAGMDELWKQGYNYSFFLQGSTGQKPVVLAARGSSALREPFVQGFQIQNLKFQLALEPRGGWSSRTRFVLECLGVLCASGLLFLFVSLVENRLAGELAVTEANQRVLRETVDRKQAEEACLKAKEEAALAQAELKEARAAQQKAEASAAELQARLETTAREAKAAVETAQNSLQQAEQKASEWQARLEAAGRTHEETLHARQAELEQARAELQQAQETINGLKERLVVAGEAEARVGELSTLLEEALAELECQRHASSAETAPEEPPVAARSKARKVNGEEATVTPVEAPPGPANTVPVVSAEETARAGAEGEPAAVPDEEDRARSSEPSTLETGAATAIAADTDSVRARESGEKPAEALPVKAEREAKDKPPKAAKRKKTRRDDQMDLFAEQPATVSAPAAPTANGEAEEAKESKPAVVEAAATEGQEKAAEDAADKAASVEMAEPPVPKRKAKEHPAEKAAETDSASEMVAEELSALEGLTATEGLAHARGDSKLYLKALRHFAEQQAGTPERIRDALLQGDSAKAERTVEDLKTAAEEIGATAMHKAAAALARGIHEQSDPAEIESLWSKLERMVSHLIADLKPALKEKEEKPSPPRRLPPPPPVNPAELRKAVNQILPLLADQDPGAKDCLKDNRTTFRSAFSAEGYVEFEQLVKRGDFGAALEDLRKAAKKHGISA